MKKRIAILLISVIIAALFLSGCSTAQTAVYYGGTVRYAVFDEPQGVFHPLLYTSRIDGLIIENIYSGLLRLNPKMEAEPDLALSYSISKDKRTVTYILRENLKWHDGMPLTADDVLYTFETISHPDYKGPQYNNIKMIEGAAEFKNGKADSIKGIKVIDDRTIEITTVEPFENATYFIGCQKIIPKHIWEKVPVSEHGSRKELLGNPVGSGPFKLKAYKPGKYVEMAAFYGYHFGEPNIDSLMILIMDTHKAEEGLVRGQIDIMELPELRKDDVEYYKSYDINVDTFVNPCYAFIGYNSGNDLLKSKRVMEALSYAINRKAIADNIMNGFGRINLQLKDEHEVTLIHHDLNENDHRPEKAIDMLKQAGWEYRDDRMYYRGEEVKLTLKYAPGDVNIERSALEIKNSLKRIGIDIEPEIVDSKSLLKDVESGNFDLYMHGWSVFNDIFFKIKDMIPSYGKWSKLMNDDTPEIYLYSPVIGMAYSENLLGVTPFPFNHFYDVHKWRFI